MRQLHRVSEAFAGGAVGGAINSLTVWLFGQFGVTAALRVTMAPPLTAPWLYQRVVWGGLWALLLLAPRPGRGTRRILTVGFLVSLFPTAAQLFYFFPRQGHDLAGLDLGILTPVFVLFFNAVWGWVAAWWALPGDGRTLRRK